MSQKSRSLRIPAAVTVALASAAVTAAAACRCRCSFCGHLQCRQGGHSASDLLGVVLGIGLPSPDDAVAVDRIEFAEICTSAGLVGRNEGGAGAAKHIKDGFAAARTIADGVGHQRDRLDRWMHCKLFCPLAADRRDARMIPDIGAVSPGIAQTERIGVLASTVLENEDQLAFWLAHELSHVELEHGYSMAVNKITIEIFSGIHGSGSSVVDSVNKLYDDAMVLIHF